MTSEDGPGRTSVARDLRTTAQGWHGVQLAVLGFVGLCGVLKDSGPTGVPRSLQEAAGVLALSALAVACCAVFLVGIAAWPLYRATAEPGPSDERRAGRALRAGIALTFTAVVLLALSAATSWWPVSGDGAARSLVRVTTEAATACGSLRESGDGLLGVWVDDRMVVVPFDEIRALRSVSSCA